MVILKNEDWLFLRILLPEANLQARNVLSFLNFSFFQEKSLTPFVLADTIGESDMGTCVLACVRLVSMSFG